MAQRIFHKEKLLPFCICWFWQISAVRWNCLISSRGQEKCPPRSCRPCRGSYRVNSVTPSEKWDTLPAQRLHSFPLFHVQLSPFRFMSTCMRQWTSTAALRSGPTPQPRSDIHDSLVWCSPGRAVIFCQSGSGCTTVEEECVFKDSKWLLVPLGHCGSVCSQRGTLAPSSCRAAQDRGRPGFQYHGRKGAELPDIHLTDHPGRDRRSTRRPEERRPASLC